LFTFILIAVLLLLVLTFGLVITLALDCIINGTEEKHPFEDSNVSLPNKLIGPVMSIKYYKVCLQMKLSGIPDDISNIIKVYLKFNKGPQHNKEMSRLVKLIASNKDALPFIREAIEKRLK